MSEEVRVDVPLEMIHADQRLPEREREGLGRRDPDGERPDEPGPARDRDPVDAVEPDARAFERLVDHRAQALQVPARRQLRHDPAVARVQIHLRCDDVRPQVLQTVEHRGGGFVAGGLDPEDVHASGA